MIQLYAQPRCLLAKCSGAVCTNVASQITPVQKQVSGAVPAAPRAPSVPMLRPLATHCDSRAFCGKPARLGRTGHRRRDRTPFPAPLVANLLDKYDLDADEALIKPQLGLLRKAVKQSTYGVVARVCDRVVGFMGLVVYRGNAWTRHAGFDYEAQGTPLCTSAARSTA